MPADYQTRVEPLIERIVQLLPDYAGQYAVGADETRLAAFVREYFLHLPAADLAAIDPKQACLRALTGWEWMQQREGGKRKVRVFTPELRKHGWRSPRAIVQTLHDDMPFLVDSLTNALSGAGFEIHSVFHPIFAVERAADGGLVRVQRGSKAAKAEGIAHESLMDVEITLPGDAADLKKLESLVGEALGTVAACVRDWKAMLERVDDAVAELKSVPVKDGAVLAEAVDFLGWLRSNHFVFLGYAEYDFSGDSASPNVEAREGALGLFALESFAVKTSGIAALPQEARHFLTQPALIDVTKAVRRSPVHRMAPMDYVAVKRFDAQGNVVGERRFLGLFTSTVYFDSVFAIPVMRRKAEAVVARSGFTTDGHDGKALATILEQLPRDELFQMPEDQLFDVAMGVLSLESRPRLAMFHLVERLERYVTCLVYLPRQRFTTDIRFAIQDILERAFHGKLDAYYTQVTDAPLARLHVRVKTNPGAIPPVDVEAVTAQLRAAVQGFEDTLLEALQAHYDERQAAHLYRVYARAFPAAYVARTPITDVLRDVAKLEKAYEKQGMSVHLAMEGEGDWHLALYQTAGHMPLSDMLPLLENLGLRVIDELPTHITPVDQPNEAWIRDMQVARPTVEVLGVESLKLRLEATLAAVLSGEAESDRFNRLVLVAGLEWREVVMLRAYAKYLKQIRYAYGPEVIEDTLFRYPAIAALLVAMFQTRFDPATADEGREKRLLSELEQAILQVQSSTDDKVLRKLVEVMRATVRVNYYQSGADGAPKLHLSFKFLPARIADMPLPRPLAEIFVYSTRVEGIHLRGGKVARGGLRWSDRPEDFRTEVLGLVKAQMVKNSVIVPEGSKGGFVLKQPPQSGNRQEMQEEGVYCYMTFLSGLLDLTDNIVDGKVVPPEQVVRHDEDDPYLVVAADKGTATFSDIANGVAQSYGFWLDDAFASGGSAGYDHKGMGITAKGGWVSVKRHFQEMGRDTQSEDFTVVGIGDMSGDVFGNGMLLSRHIRLVAAFNHLHVFIDPNPEAARSFEERERLFHLPRSSWADYNAALISSGGGVFERSAKAIAISPEMKERFDLAADHMAPEELIRALLKAPVDLLWNGGIGTYVKAADETHEQVGDRANNAVRVDGRELRCLVVGEGGNLGFTQRGRVEYALAGGRINTDAIDNSAGVDTSDHEVNMKIALGIAVRKGLSIAERDAFLAEMTPVVEMLVLRDNQLQTQALTIAEQQGVGLVEFQSRQMRILEKKGLLDRAIEFLPSDEALAHRQAAGQGLTRPELAVLLAYSKMDVYRELLASAIPDVPHFVSDLYRYFPPEMKARFGAEIEAHPLRREIIATVVTNSIINRVGSTFFYQVSEETGVPACDVTRAYAVVRDSFRLRDLWAQIESLSGVVKLETQTEMFLAINRLVYWLTLWCLRQLPQPIDVGEAVARFRPQVETMLGIAPEMLRAEADGLRRDAAESLMVQGVPEGLAQHIALLPALEASLDVVTVAEEAGVPLAHAGEVYFALANRLKLDWLRAAAERLELSSHWARQAQSAVITELTGALQRMVASVLAEGAGALPTQALDQWIAARQSPVERAVGFIEECQATPQRELAMVVTAVAKLGLLE